MKIKNLFYPLSLAMAAMTLTACSSTEGEEAVTAETAEAVSQTGTFQVSINVGPAQTRAISVGGNNGQTLYFNWDDNDEVQVVKDGATSVAGTLTADVSEGNSAYATLKGTLSGTFAVNDQVTLYYHSANINYTGQKGTLPDVSTNKSFLTATSTVQQIGLDDGTVKDGSTKYLVMSNASYDAMQAYLDISFTDAVGNALAITQLDIWTSGGKLVKTVPLVGEKTYATEASPLTITPDAATDHFFLALRDEAGASNTIYFKATTADNTYIYSQDSQLAIGGYYYAASPKAMTGVAYYAATASDIGKVIGRNGKIYDTTDAATTDGTTAEAMIAFVGNVNGECTHGLAISLTDAYEYNATFAQATGENIIPVWATAHPIAGGTWRLPTEADLQRMIWGYYPESFAEATGAAKTVLTEGYYWTSTEIDADNAKGMYYDDGTTYASVQSLAKTTYCHVRACLAF